MILHLCLTNLPYLYKMKLTGSKFVILLVVVIIFFLFIYIINLYVLDMENSNPNVLTIKPTPRCIMEFFLVHVEKPENVSTLSKAILNAVNLEAKMDRIRFFPEQLELRKTFPDSSERLEPGIVFIFEVDVVCKNNKLQILEKVTLFYVVAF